MTGRDRVPLKSEINESPLPWTIVRVCTYFWLKIGNFFQTTSALTHSVRPSPRDFELLLTYVDLEF